MWPNMKKSKSTDKAIKEVTRKIKKEVERELWGRAAARCQFDGCNKLLYKHSVTQEPVNLAEMAHIYSFSEDGPRGWGLFRLDRTGINDFHNLMLVCDGCHKLIDSDKLGVKYSAPLLKGWKEAHETRVRVATGITPEKRSHVVIYSTRIGDEGSPINMGMVYEAMFPNWYAADERPVNLSMESALDDSSDGYWTAHEAHLNKEFERRVRPLIEEGNPNQFSLFALAPQPLLIQLGSLFTDKVPLNVYQPIREPKTWAWQPHPDGFEFTVTPPADTSAPPAVLFSLSDRIDKDRILRAVGTAVSIWEVTGTDCHNDFLRSEAQLVEFRQVIRKMFVDLRSAHPSATEILIFPVMPAACAVELGRVRMPKADLPWVIFDQNNKRDGFVRWLTIGGNQ